MKVLYKEPKSKNKFYYRWYDNNGTYDIWYEKETSIYNCNDTKLPEKLKKFLEKWSLKIEEYKKTYIEPYPVKLAHIIFIYDDVVYSLYPTAVSAVYKTNFMSDDYYEVSWDSLFENYQLDIREDMEKELGVKYSKYIGFLD